MACDTCGHTMANLGVEGQRIFWCGRCGTVKSIDPGGFESVEAPELVARLKAANELFAVSTREWDAVREACGIPNRGG